MARLFAHLICFGILVGLSFCAKLKVHNDSGPKSEKELREHLFRNYDKLVRPVKHAAHQMAVFMSISPIRVRELDAKDQILVLEVLPLITWVDEYLQWDSKNFGNISILRVPSTEVWRPDLAVYTSPEQSEMFPKPGTNVLLYESGTVIWVPMFTIRSKCPMVRFSKKTVTCNIKIGSWTFGELLLDLQLRNEEIDMSDYQDSNPDWKLVAISAQRMESYYPCCKEAYPSLNFNITLMRRRTEDYFSDIDETVAVENFDFEL